MLRVFFVWCIPLDQHFVGVQWKPVIRTFSLETFPFILIITYVFL